MEPSTSQGGPSAHPERTDDALERPHETDAAPRSLFGNNDHRTPCITTNLRNGRDFDIRLLLDELSSCVAQGGGELGVGDPKASRVFRNDGSKPPVTNVSRWRFCLEHPG